MISIASKRNVESGGVGAGGALAPHGHPNAADAIELKESRAMSQYSKALETQLRGELDLAINLYTSLLASDLFQEDGGAEVGAERSEASKLSSQSLKLKYLALKNLGELQATNGDSSSALSNLLLATDIDDTDVMVLGRLGKLALDEGDSSLAKKVLARALHLQPTYWPAVENFATTLYCLGDYEYCIEFIETQALVLDENWIHGYLLLYLCQIATKDTESSFNSKSALTSLSQQMTEARDIVIQCLVDVPIFLPQVSPEDLAHLANSIHAKAMNASKGVQAMDTPKQTFAPSLGRSYAPGISSPPFISPDRLRSPHSSAMIAPIIGSPTSIGLPPTMMYGLHVMSNAMQVDDQPNYDDDLVSETNGGVSNETSEFIGSLTSWLVQLQLMRKSTADCMSMSGDMGMSLDAKPVERLKMVGTSPDAIAISMTRERLNLDELVSTLFKHVTDISLSDDPSISLISGLDFYLDDELLTEELALEIIAELNPKSSHSGGAHSSTSHRSNSSLRNEKSASNLSSRAKATSAPKKHSRKPRYTSLTSEDSNHGQYTSEDEEEIETSLLSHQSSSVANLMAANNSRSNNIPQEIEVIDDDDDDDAVVLVENETLTGSSAGSRAKHSSSTHAHGHKESTPSASNSAAAGGRGKTPSIQNADSKTKSAFHLTQEPLESFVANILRDLGENHLLTKQDLSEKLLPNDTVKHSVNVDDLLAATAASAKSTDPLLASTSTSETPLQLRSAFPTAALESAHVLSLINEHLRFKTITEALKLVAEHICHLYYFCDWRKNVNLRIRKTLTRLTSLDRSASTEPSMEVLTMQPTGPGVEIDTILLPHLHLYMAESVVSYDRNHLVPAYLLQLQQYSLPIIIPRASPSSPLVLDLGATYRTSDLNLPPDQLSSLMQGCCADTGGKPISMSSFSSIDMKVLTRREVDFYMRGFWIELCFHLFDVPSSFGFRMSSAEEDELLKTDVEAASYCIEALSALMSASKQRKSLNPKSVQLYSLIVPHLPPDWRTIDGRNLDEKRRILIFLKQLAHKRLVTLNPTMLEQNYAPIDPHSCPTATSMDPSQVHDSMQPTRSTLEEAVQEYLMEDMSLSQALLKKKYLRALRRTAELFWKAKSPLVMHCLAHMLHMDANMWRPKLLDVLVHMCTNAVETLESFSKEETRAMQQESINLDSVSQTRSMLDTSFGAHFYAPKGTGKPKHHALTGTVPPAIASLIVSTLTIFVQIVRGEIGSAPPSTPNSATPVAGNPTSKEKEEAPLHVKVATTALLTRLLSLPYVRKFAYGALLSKYQMPDAAQKASAALASDTDAADKIWKLSCYKFESCLRSLLFDLSRNLTSSVPTAIKRKSKSKYAHLMVLYFWILRSMPLEVLDAERLMNFLWASHTFLSSDDVCHAGDGILLLTSIRFVNEMEDTIDAVLRLGRSESCMPSDELPPAASIASLASLLGLPPYTPVSPSSTTLSTPRDVSEKVTSTSPVGRKSNNKDTSSAQVPNLSPLLRLGPVELVLVFGKGMLSANPSRNEEIAIEELRKVFTLPPSYSSLTNTFQASNSLSKMRHELLHRCCCCLYGLELPLPRTLKGGNSSKPIPVKPHRMSGKGVSQFFGSSTPVAPTTSRPFPTLVNPSEVALAAFGASHAAITNASQMALLWEQTGEHAAFLERYAAQAREHKTSYEAIQQQRKEQAAERKRQKDAERAERARLKAIKNAQAAAARALKTNEKVEKRKPGKKTAKKSGDSDLDNTAPATSATPYLEAATTPLTQFMQTAAASRPKRAIKARNLPLTESDEDDEETSSCSSSSDESSDNETPENHAVPTSSQGLAQKFFLQRLYSLPGSSMILPYNSYHTEDIFHLYRYIHPLLLERGKTKISAKHHEIVNRVYLVFGDGPFLEPKDNATASQEIMLKRISSWFETPHLAFNETPPSFLSFVLSPTVDPSAVPNTIDLDPSPTISPPREDPLVEPISLSVSLSARHRYGGVYDNICYLKAMSRASEASSTPNKSHVIHLLKQQLYARPYHLIALQELASNSLSLMISHSNRNIATDASASMEDASLAKRHFFSSVRALLLAAQKHKEVILDAPLRSKKLTTGLLKVIQGRWRMDNIDASSLPEGQISARIFTSDDSTYLVNIRKQLIFTLWRSARYFKEDKDKIASLISAKALCSAWMSEDSSIGSPAALQSGLWLVPFIKGRIEEDIVDIRMPMPSAVPRARACLRGVWEVEEVIHQGKYQKPVPAATIQAQHLQLFGLTSPSNPTAKEFTTVPFPEKPTVESVESWLSLKVTDYESILELFHDASGKSSLSSSDSAPSSSKWLQPEPCYRLHCARLALLKHLYEPTIAKYLSPQYQDVFLSQLDHWAPEENHKYLKATTVSGYYENTLGSIFEPTAIQAELSMNSPSLIPLCLPAEAFFETVSDRRSGKKLTIELEKSLDSILDGFKECMDLKRGGKFYKSFYKLAQVLSGISTPNLNIPTAPLMKQIFSQPGCFFPPSTVVGRLVDRATALELMSVLINFKPVPPKTTFWTFILYQDDHPDLNRPDVISSLQCKYISLTLSIMDLMAEEYGAVARDRILAGKGAELIVSPEPMDISPDTSSGPTARSTRAALAATAASPIHISMKVVLSLITYATVIVDRISTEKIQNTEVNEVVSANLPQLLCRLVDPFMSLMGSTAAEIQTKLGQSLSMPFLELLRASALTWKLIKRTHPNTTYSHVFAPILCAYHLWKRTPDLYASAITPNTVATLLETAMPSIVNVLSMDLPNPVPFGTPPIFTYELGPQAANPASTANTGPPPTTTTTTKTAKKTSS